MKTDPLPEPLPERLPERPSGAATGLPVPRRGARWRWSGRRKALVAGGAMATVLGFGASAAGASTSTPGPPAGAHGQPPTGAARPTVGGEVTAVSGNDVTVQTRKDTTTTVVVSSATTYKTATRPRWDARGRGGRGAQDGRLRRGAGHQAERRHRDRVQHRHQHRGPTERPGWPCQGLSSWICGSAALMTR